MKSNKKFDFLVIGAAKSGTTTMYEWLKKHPEIFMPEGKELPLFSKKQYDPKMVKAFFQKHCQDANNQIIGKATPQYTSGAEEVTPKTIAKNIKDHNQDIKLVVLLRNPIDRAYSDYKMAYRRGYIKSSFADAVKKELDEKTLQNHRAKPTDYERFIVASEYGRILCDYLKYFSKKQILITTTEELKRNPKGEYKKITTFLGVNSSFLPPDINRQYHKGGSKPKVRLLTPARIYKIPLLKRSWTVIVPDRVRRIVEFKINQWNISADNGRLDKDSETYRHLLNFYKEDVQKLKKNFDVVTNWENFS